MADVDFVGWGNLLDFRIRPFPSRGGTRFGAAAEGARENADRDKNRTIGGDAIRERSKDGASGK